jgi:phosphoserine aminotransferase
MIHNFTAGPSILPKEVLQEAAQAIVDYKGQGFSLLEVSHRGNVFVPILEEAIALVKELMGLTDEYEVLFLHGGASTQFMQLPYNLLDANATAAYIDTGVWSSKAIKEAQQFGNVAVVASSKDSNYSFIPTNYTLPTNASYLHITTNNTIYGTQYHFIPETSLPLIADMSSDIFSKATNYLAYDCIYAGAQKNMGTAGVNLLVIKNSLLGKVQRHIPTMLDYKEHIKAGSLLNTPPVFAIYVALLTLRWVKQQGIAAIEELNNKKANLFYNTLDSLPIFKGTVEVDSRSKMNACFNTVDPNLEHVFLESCQKENIIGIKGHRLSGGFRASLYNALPLSSVEHLVAVMQNFAQQNG